MRGSMEDSKRFVPGDVVQYTDSRRVWGCAEVVGYDNRVERLIIRFAEANMYTHSCGNAVGGHKGYWAIPDELTLIKGGGGNNE